MRPKSFRDRKWSCLAILAMATMACCQSAGALAAMTPEQMTSLKGAAQLELSVDKLLRRCGLPAAILDSAAATVTKQRIQWQGVDMRLSALDWDIVYATRQPKPVKPPAWVNPGEIDDRCSAGLVKLQFTAKGHVGVLTVTKKPDGFGYITRYTEPESLYRAHKLTAAKASLPKGLPVSDLTSRYGQPDDVVRRPGNLDVHRYWVLTLRETRPETLHAVDFEIDRGVSKTYAISTTGVDFVQRQLEALLRKWERDYVLD